MGRHLVTRVRRFRVREEKKVIRVESDETQEQDHVRKSLNLSRRRNEFFFGVTIAAVTRHPRLGQFASVNESLTTEGLAPLKSWQWPWQIVEYVGKGPVDKRYVGVFVS